jgi:hypothetical protein
MACTFTSRSCSGETRNMKLIHILKSWLSVLFVFAEYRNNFNKQSLRNTTYNFEYDYNSIMHYGQYFFRSVLSGYGPDKRKMFTERSARKLYTLHMHAVKCNCCVYYDNPNREHAEILQNLLCNLTNPYATHSGNSWVHVLQYRFWWFKPSYSVSF